MRARDIGLVLVVCVTVGIGTVAQDVRGSLPEMVRQGPGMERIPVRDGNPATQAQLQKMFEMRQAEIRSDAQKLLQLSTELKQYVDTSSTTVLSLDMIKKAEAIEKLAHKVKQKMKENT